MRFKPNKGLRAVFDDLELDLWQLSETLTECAIPERLWLKLQRFEGTEPDLIVTCENLGAYIDLPMPCGYMVVYAPGANIETAVKILKYFPETRWFHFGDVDPDGLKIAQTLAREAKRPLTFFVPSFAEEYLPGRPVKKPWGEVPGRKVFQELKRKHTRLFQEVFMLDGRLNSEINGLSSAAMEEKDNLHCIMVR